MFSAVISLNTSAKNRMIIPVVAAKIWYLKNVRFLLGHPVEMMLQFSHNIRNPFQMSSVYNS